MIKKLALFLMIVAPTVLWFWPSIASAKIPVAFDAMMGLYHPFRDHVATEYPNGMPFRNFLITDAFRQQFPWRSFAISELKAGRVPWWNPFNGAGTPLLATLQAAPFYPLNLVYLLMPFASGWTLQVILQSLIASLGVYMLLRALGRSGLAASLASAVYVLSGPFVVWATWNTTGHVLALFPWILWSIVNMSRKCEFRYFILTILLWVSQGLAGYPQPFIMLSIVQGLFLLLYMNGHRRIMAFVVSVLVGLILLPVYLPAMEFAALSNRAIDQGTSLLTKQDWFLPPVQLLQMIVPDFFGNPATLNYVGVFNYTEFTSYIGVTALLAVAFALSERRKDIRWFFGSVALVAFAMALPNPISRLPFQLGLPLFGDSQPSRWLLVAVPNLVFLSAYGFDKLLKLASPRAMVIVVLMPLLWAWSVKFYPDMFGFDQAAVAVAVRNLVIPTTEMMALLFVVFVLGRIAVVSAYSKRLITGVILALLILVPGIRVATKYTPFVEPELIYPDTETTRFLQQSLGEYRYTTLDRRIMPPNVNLSYQLSSIELYDPLYLENYGRLLTAAKTDTFPDQSDSFNRILTIENIESPVVDMLGVKYVLSMDELISPGLEQVFIEGQTRIYENQEVWPRAFVLPSLPGKIAELSSVQPLIVPQKYVYISPIETRVEVSSQQGGYLVTSDSYHPDWQVEIGGNPGVIENWFGLRATIITPGEHEVTYLYRNSLL